jgi:hypothetical protein
MPVLKSLSFTSLPKTGNDPVQLRRAKFVAKLEEQKLLLKDPNHVRTVQRWTKVDGQRQATTKQQAVRAWWKTDPTGQVVMSVKFGAKPLELGQGRYRRSVQGQAAGGDRHPDLGRPSWGAGRAVQPGCQDRVDREGAQGCLIIGAGRWVIVARLPSQFIWRLLIDVRFGNHITDSTQSSLDVRFVP